MKDVKDSGMGGEVTNFERSYLLNERLHKVIPGGSHTYSKGEDQFPWRGPKVIANARGAYTWDVDGNQYIDWAMGNRVIVLGHAHPAVNEAVKKAIDDGTNFSRPSLLELELAEYLLDFLPQFDMVKFGKNGSDATTAAIKLARAYTGRKYVAFCADHPFFSIHDWFIGTTAVRAGVLPETASYTLKFRYNDIASVEELFDRHPGDIAALILEPVKNDEPRGEFLQRLRNLADKQGTVLIFDENISGMRFDLRGAHHRWRVYPHLACYGKAMANGYSFSLLAGIRPIMELGGIRHSTQKVFLLSQTHASESVGIAACRATIEECLRVNVTDHIWGMGAKLTRSFRALAQNEGVADYVRIVGFDCNPQILCTHIDGAYWPALHTAFHEEVISHGILIPWTTITFSHGDRELASTLNAIQLGMRKVKRALELGDIERAFEGSEVKPVFRSRN